jgi:hypothetical protein
MASIGVRLDRDPGLPALVVEVEGVVGVVDVADVVVLADSLWDDVALELA